MGRRIYKTNDDNKIRTVKSSQGFYVGCVENANTKCIKLSLTLFWLPLTHKNANKKKIP